MGRILVAKKICESERVEMCSILDIPGWTSVGC